MNRFHAISFSLAPRSRSVMSARQGAYVLEEAGSREKHCVHTSLPCSLSLEKRTGRRRKLCVHTSLPCSYFSLPYRKEKPGALAKASLPCSLSLEKCTGRRRKLCVHTSLPCSYFSLPCRKEKPGALA